MMDLRHVTIGGGYCFLRTAALLTRAQVGRIPVPPVMLGMRLLILAVVLLRLVEKFCQSSNVHPLAAGKPRRDLLEQPTITVWILKRGKRVVGTTFRVAPSDPRL